MSNNRIRDNKGAQEIKPGEKLTIDHGNAATLSAAFLNQLVLEVQAIRKLLEKQVNG